jgi:ABC-type transport system involved in multi-copper enzyme maturation permease subunit
MRIVIQVSMFLAIPLMGVCLYLMPNLAPWYIAYVLLFNMLVGPVFSAGSVTSERERATLELLLVTILTPVQILWGKLFSGLRVSVVLTSLILWPVLLAVLMVPRYWTNAISVVVYLLIIAATCVTTSMMGLFASVVFRKTSTSLMMTYMAIILLFFGPVAGRFFADTFYADTRIETGGTTALASAVPAGDNVRSRRAPVRRNTVTVSEIAEMASFTSPFSAVRSVPLDMDDVGGPPKNTNPASDWPTSICFLVFAVVFNLGLYGTMSMLFKRRWMVAQ